VAAWLEERHGLKGLHGRMEKLSMGYQKEQSDYEDADATRVFFRVLLEIARRNSAEHFDVAPKDVADRMNTIATEEGFAPDDEGKTFTNARRVGWMLKRQRFKKGDRSESNKLWSMSRKDIEAGASAYGVTDDPETGAGGDTDHEGAAV
jgi:hypothetical protein